MAPIPVFCDNCGSLFLANNIIGGGGGATVTFTNSKYGPCPVCNSMGRILDGTYRLMGDVVTLLSAPAWSVEKLQRVEAVLRAAQTGVRPVDEVLTDVSEFSADLADYIRGALSKGWTALQVIALLLAIVTFLQGQNAQQQLTQLATSEQRVESVLEHLTHSQPAPIESRPSKTSHPTSNAKRRKKPPKTHGRNKRKHR